MIYVCPHYADPFSEIIFQTRQDAEQYVRTMERVIGEEIEIEEREDDREE